MCRVNSSRPEYLAYSSNFYTCITTSTTKILSGKQNIDYSSPQLYLQMLEYKNTVAHFSSNTLRHDSISKVNCTSLQIHQENFVENFVAYLNKFA